MLGRTSHGCCRTQAGVVEGAACPYCACAVPCGDGVYTGEAGSTLRTEVLRSQGGLRITVAACHWLHPGT